MWKWFKRVFFIIPPEIKPLNPYCKITCYMKSKECFVLSLKKPEIEELLEKLQSDWKYLKVTTNYYGLDFSQVECYTVRYFTQDNENG